MVKFKFLNILKSKGKLKLVGPSHEVMRSYLEKSESNLISSKILLENNRLEESVSLAYYCMYNSVLALLFRVGIKCENHSGSIILMKELFGLDNSKISFAKKERIDKQYYVDFKVVLRDAVELLDIAESFKGLLVDFISRLTEERVGFYREKFLELF